MMDAILAIGFTAIVIELLTINAMNVYKRIAAREYFTPEQLIQEQLAAVKNDIGTMLIPAFRDVTIATLESALSMCEYANAIADFAAFMREGE